MSIRKLTKASTAVIAVAVLGVTGCAGGQGVQADPTPQQEVSKGGAIVVAMSGAPDTLDATFTSSKHATYILPNFCEALYSINADLEIIPQLASDLPTISDDGLTYSIKLGDGIKFNDGTDFDATAVKISLDRAKTNPLSTRASGLKAISEVKVVDPSTIELTLSSPNAPLTSVLANREGMILSPAQLEKLGDDFGTDPVCVGPFSFDSRPSADRIELKKSEFYYDKDKVNLDAVTFVTITQPNVRSTNLLSGDVDVANDVGSSDVAKLKSSSNVDVTQVTSLGYQLITINVANSNGAGKPPYELVDAPMANPDIRKAFELSLDRDAINEVVYGGFKVPGCSPISPSSPFFTKVECTKQNIEEAKKIIAASGLATPIPVTLTVKASDDEHAKLGTVIQAMAEKVGFNITLKPSESTTGGNAAIAGDFDIYMNGWSGRVDPAQNIDVFWAPTSALNYSGVDDKELNKVLDEAAVTSDFDTRKSLYKTAAERMLEDRNYIIMFHDQLILGSGKNVSGIEYYGDGVVRMKTAGFIN